MTTNKKPQANPSKPNKPRGTPTASTHLADGSMVELVHDPVARKTGFAVWRDEQWDMRPDISIGDTERLAPFSAMNNLIKHHVVLLPSAPDEYDTAEELVHEVQAYIHRYVDVSERFERLTAYYVLLSWVYDRFNELPYLRVRGDYGSGKTRFLLIVGALCNKPVFASGASTVSPLFHALDAFRGTLVLDESDFRLSDEKAEIVKILNNGNVRGFPVLRTEMSAQHEYNPRAFHVFGPKIIATRGHFDDKALESRFITEEMGRQSLRRDIPISLPDTYRDEARCLRNKLLLYRFKIYSKLTISDDLGDPSIEPRLNQIFQPLLAVVGDSGLVQDIRKIARAYHRDRIVDRSLEVEAQVLECIRLLIDEASAPRIPIRDVALRFQARHGAEYDNNVTPKWIGTIVRRKLQLRTEKSHGIYVIPLSERPRLERLFAQYGIDDENTLGDTGDTGDVGEVEGDAAQ